MHVNAHVLNSHEGVVKQFAKWKTEHHSAFSDRRLQNPLLSHEISCETLENHHSGILCLISLCLPGLSSCPADYFDTGHSSKILH